MDNGSILKEGDGWRVRIVEDPELYDSSYIDDYEPEEQEEAREELEHMIRTWGIYGLIAEIECQNGIWEQIDSIWSNVGNPRENPYLDDLICAAKDALNIIHKNDKWCQYFG